MEAMAGALIIIVVFVAAFVVAAALWRGYVLSVLWGWFFVPIFHLPPLGVAQAIGIALVVGMFTMSTQKDGDKESGVSHKLGVIFLAPALALGVGWVIKQWM